MSADQPPTSQVRDLSDADLAAELQLARKWRADALAELHRAEIRQNELHLEQYWRDNARWREADAAAHSAHSSPVSGPQR
jgi:hypothetical protein